MQIEAFLNFSRDHVMKQSHDLVGSVLQPQVKTLGILEKHL